MESEEFVQESGEVSRQACMPVWHFRFGGPEMERLVAGRERIYLDRFWNEFSATPSRFNEASREHYAKSRAAGVAGGAAGRQAIFNSVFRVQAR